MGKREKKALLLDLNKAELFESMFKGIERIFLLTWYYSEMLFQAKELIDTDKKLGTEFIVHLWVHTSRMISFLIFSDTI